MTESLNTLAGASVGDRKGVGSASARAFLHPTDVAIAASVRAANRAVFRTYLPLFAFRRTYAFGLALFQNTRFLLTAVHVFARL